MSIFIVYCTVNAGRLRVCRTVLFLTVQIKGHGRICFFLFRCGVIISDALVYGCYLFHFIFGQFKIEDFKVFPHMVGVLAARYHYEAHLSVPSEDDLSRGLAVFFCQLCEYRLIDESSVPVSQRVPCHDPDIIVLEFSLRVVCGKYG